jgi:dipeptidyl aminopeptidase/acylaminoacyl peptidase
MQNKYPINNKTTLPFGKWPSPITPDLLAERKRLGEALWSLNKDSIFWLMSENGKGRIYFSQDGKTAKLMSSEEYDVRGTVSYGGGEFAVGNEFVIFANRNGRLYRLEIKTGNINPITPGWGCMASPAISKNQQWVLYVFSDGEKDLIGVVNAHGFGWPTVLVSGADFYMHPVWHPGGELIAWVEWDNPHLPWQASRVKIGEVGGMQVKLFSEDWIAGSDQQSATQPQFSPDGKWLSYIQTSGDWDELILYNLKSKKTKILFTGDKVGFGNPGWVQGQRFYGWSADSQRIFYRLVNGGTAALWEADLKTGKSIQLSIGTYTWISQLDVSRKENRVLMRASSPHLSPRLIEWKEGKKKELTQPSFSSIHEDFLPNPKMIHWQAGDGSTIHGTYYPPLNPNFYSEGKPPLIVEIHAGPTMNNLLVFTPDRAYFTSRGYAILAVDYRGSTGYGKTYQDSIRGKWGVVDVQDAIGGARAAVEQGLCDEKRIAIMGSSAGGFTVLNSLIQFPGFFKAAICSYPVCDLLEDIQKTHKLERYYNQYLIGDPKKDHRQYLARSPLQQADKIHDPIAIFHGENDHVVSIDQTRRLMEKLKQQGTPHLYVTYPDEGHGFRKMVTLRDFYQRVEAFLNTYLQ